VVLALPAYAAFLVYQSLAAGGSWACRGPVLDITARISRTDLLANLLAYVPLGVLLVLAMSRRSAGDRSRTRSPLLVALVGAACVTVLSTAMEVVQACQSARVSSIYDVLGNVAGGLAGILGGLALTTRVVVPPLVAGAHDPWHRWLPSLTLAIVIAWIASQTLPWTFSVDVGTVRSNLSFLRRGFGLDALDGWRVLRHAAAWVAIACACHLLARDAARRAATIAAAVVSSLVLQLLVDARAPLSIEELLGVVLAIVIVVPPSLLGAPAWTHPYPWAAGIFLGALASIAAYELEPAAGGAASGTFSLWPQVGLAGLRGAMDYAMLFAWFGLASVVAAEWASHDGSRRSPARWPAVAVAATLAFEIAQVWMPGRGADLSAPFFTLLAVLATRACLATPARGQHRGSRPCR
jgi:VanZ family protein